MILKHAFTDGAAETFLKVYDATIAYAGLNESGKINGDGDGADSDEEDGIGLGEDPPINIGDWVQWESQGVLQFPMPRRVTNVFNDPEHGWQVSVDGYPGALPMNQIQSATPQGANPSVNIPPTPNTGSGANAEPIQVFLSGDRLQITADVSLKGVQKLEKMLAKYKEILELNQDTEEPGE